MARVGYGHFISNKGEWNNCFSKFSNWVLAPIFISTILQSVRKENLAHYFPYDVKLGLLAHSRSFLANQKARNAIVGAENLLKGNSHCAVIAGVGFLLVTSASLARFVNVLSYKSALIVPVLERSTFKVFGCFCHVNCLVCHKLVALVSSKSL